MLFIHKKLIQRLAAPYQESSMQIGYAKAQSLSATTNQAILLMNEEKIVILFLNFFITKVVHKVEFSAADLLDSKLRFEQGLSVSWSFNVQGQRWRFQIMKQILPLGTMQGDFLDFLRDTLR